MELVNGIFKTEKACTLRTRVGEREFNVVRDEVLKGDTVNRPFEVLKLECVDEVTGGGITKARVPHSRSVTAEIRHFPAERVGHKGFGDWRLPTLGVPFHNARGASGGRVRGVGCVGALGRLVG